MPRNLRDAGATELMLDLFFLKGRRDYRRAESRRCILDEPMDFANSRFTVAVLSLRNGSLSFDQHEKVVILNLVALLHLDFLHRAGTV